MSFVLRHMRDNLWSGRLDIFPEDRLVHGFSARQGGVSPAPFDALNMALHVGDDPALVWENRRRYFAALGLDAERICTIRQVHGTEIVRAVRRDAGRGARAYEDALADADAVITNDSGVPLMLCFADCVPVLLYDPVHHAAGVVHAGWKGTVAEIGRKTVQRMAETFGSRPQDILAGIGPSIGACCFEVGEEVAAAVSALPEARGAAVVPVEPMPGDAAAEASDGSQERRWAGAGTRTRVALVVDDEGRAGMHAFRSGRIVPVRSLPLAVPAIRDLGLTERAVWRRHYRPGMRVRTLAPGVGEPVVLLSDAEGDRVLTAAGRPTGRRRVEEVVDASGLGLGELRYTVHVSGFWQVHRDAPAALVERVVRAAVPDPARAGAARVLELYSGAGLLTLPLAALGCEIRSLEADERAVRDARRTLHDFGAAHLHVGRAGADSVASLGSGFGPGRDGRADVVVLDPPRRGAGREVVEAVAALRPRRIVLVGCDPAALARDLRTFIGRGCRIVAMSALDMFPHTHHFETIAVLEGA